MTAVPHIGFIVAAYAVTALVVGGLIAAVVIDRRTLGRRLDELEARAGRGRGRTGVPR